MATNQGQGFLGFIGGITQLIGGAVARRRQRKALEELTQLGGGLGGFPGLGGFGLPNSGIGAFGNPFGLGQGGFPGLDGSGLPNSGIGAFGNPFGLGQAGNLGTFDPSLGFGVGNVDPFGNPAFNPSPFLSGQARFQDPFNPINTVGNPLFGIGGGAIDPINGIVGLVQNLLGVVLGSLGNGVAFNSPFAQQAPLFGTDIEGNRLRRSFSNQLFSNATNGLGSRVT